MLRLAFSKMVLYRYRFYFLPWHISPMTLSHLSNVSLLIVRGLGCLPIAILQIQFPRIPF